MTHGTTKTISAGYIADLWSTKIMAAIIPSPADSSWWNAQTQAREFAWTSHDGQTRKGTQDPYFIHLGEVALVIHHFKSIGLLTVEEYGIPLQSAWLHDTVEDCGVLLPLIEKQFGSQTAKSVSALTKKEKTDGFNPMSDSLERIRAAGKIAALTKAADRISNLSWVPPPEWSLKQVCRYGQEGLLIAATLSEKLPVEACLVLELAANTYLKHFTEHRSVLAPKKSLQAKQ